MNNFVGKVAVPGTSEIAVAPRPLLFSRREMVAGHMQHTSLGVILIAALKVEARVHAHVRCRHENVLVVRDVYTSRIVHFIIGTSSYGERRDGSLSMVENGIDVGWEHTLVLIIHLHGRIGPPKESLRQRRTVAHAPLYFKIGTTGTKRKARCPFLMKHTLHLVHPYRHAPILILHDGGINRHIGRGTVVLRPVKLNAAADPRAE